MLIHLSQPGISPLSELLPGALFLVPSECVGASLGARGNSCTRSLPPALVRVVNAFERPSRSLWSQKLRRDAQARGTPFLKRGDNNVEGDRKGREKKERKRERGGWGREERKEEIKKKKKLRHLSTTLPRLRFSALTSSPPPTSRSMKVGSLGNQRAPGFGRTGLVPPRLPGVHSPSELFGGR